jgi:hypothetical protein
MIVHTVKEFSVIGYIYKERLKLEDKLSKNLSHRINFCQNSQFVAHETTLKGHGSEADFLGFLQKSVRHRFLTLHFEPF